MKVKDSLPTFTTSKAIRNGCKIKFYSISKGKEVFGEVVKNSYGEKTGQHTFTVLLENGDKTMVKGRNLYPNILQHIQGEESKKISK